MSSDEIPLAFLGIGIMSVSVTGNDSYKLPDSLEDTCFVVEKTEQS